MTRALPVVLILFGSALQAQQQHPLVGVWRVSYQAGLRMENGASTPIMATGSLTIEARDDSLIAVLATDSSANIPARPPSRLAAKVSAGDAAFVSRTKATLNINGAESQAMAVSTWQLSAKGDSLAGTVERKVEGYEGVAPGPTPVTGTRRQP